MPKELLPIVDRPIIHHVVDELVASGIRDIVFITRRHERALADYFSPAPRLEAALEAQGKDRLLRVVRSTVGRINPTFLHQDGPYGNGTPALNGGRTLDGPFVYAFGDDLVSATVPFTRQLLDMHARTGGVVLGAQEVPPADVPRYGMIEADPDGRVTRIIEKPNAGEVTSNLVSFGRFVLPPDIVGHLEATPTGKDNELWLTDAIESYRAAGGPVHVCPIQDGQWFTTGDPSNYLAAFVHYVLARDDLREDFLRLIRSI